MSHIKNHVTANCRQYIPRNPEKYVGKEKKVITRSTWEWTMCQWLDSNPSVLEWCSECTAIKYQDPIRPIDPRTKKAKIRTYYPDFYMVVKDKAGNIVRYIIEVKPNKETSKPRNTAKKNPATLLREQATYVTNQAKWAAAQRVCKSQGIIFKILTEKEIYGK